MKQFVLVFAVTLASLWSYATHITGGELMYEYIGGGSNMNSDKYRITLRLFRDCFSTGPMLEGEQVRVGIYSSRGLEHTLPLPLITAVSSMSLNTSAIPCLTGNPRVCYQIAYYSNIIELERNVGGYTLVQTTCCRIGGIANLVASTGAGATYSTKIPGSGIINNSPEFLLKDTALVCSGKNFRLPFTAHDMDGDSLSYAFGDAYGNMNSGNQPLPQQLSFNILAYNPPYSGSNPLGSNVSINPTTGVISGKAPPTGRYVVAVTVTEWRNGVAINEHRKDFILSVQSCDFVAAELPNPWIICDDYNVQFENTSYSAVVTSYSWSFGDPTNTADTSSDPTPTYTYGDTGIYKVKLVVRGGAGCIDSAEADVHVFPGFSVDFDATTSCVQNPVRFTDKSQATFGEINKWKWDFGVTGINNDTSGIKNPNYHYLYQGNYPVKLVATSTKGCTDSITRTVSVTDKPYLKLSFKDTLVCGFDTLQLSAEGTGAFTWSPNQFINNSSSSTPIVYPPTDMEYVVTLNENGCVGSDTVKISKLNSITVKIGRDTLICTGDTIELTAESQANYYAWSPSDMVVSPAQSNTISVPINNNLTYHIAATLGRCEAKDSLAVAVSPYPVANAGKDVEICALGKAQLAGYIEADQFSWTPNYAMFQSQTLQPTVAPTSTTAYILTATYSTGCLKSVSDTVLVSVSAPVNAFAGNDTSLVVNQPLQLNATGGVNYQWFPVTGLSDPFVSNPYCSFPAGVDTMKYLVRVSDDKGCEATDEIMITRFKTGATVFVPTAFTPNADGKNDLLRPILAGIKHLNFFKVYNRWGHMIYSTSEHGRGWDGTIKGIPQNSGTYVYVLEATDYTGSPIQQKGTFVLIR